MDGLDRICAVCGTSFPGGDRFNDHMLHHRLSGVSEATNGSTNSICLTRCCTGGLHRESHKCQYGGMMTIPCNGSVDHAHAGTIDLTAATQGPTGQGSALTMGDIVRSIDDNLERVNGAGIERSKLRQSPGRPKGTRNLHAKHPSSMGRKFLKAGLDWQTDFALAIKGNKRERIKLWLKLLPYLVTTTNKVRVKKWKGRPSKAAMIALEALEGKE